MAKGVFVPGLDAPEEAGGDALVFAFRDRHLLVVASSGGARVPELAELVALEVLAERRLYLGSLGERPVFCLDLPEPHEPPPGMVLRNLRGLFQVVSDEHFWLAARAAQIVDWDRDHRFCGRCGAATERHASERAKRCPRCGLNAYPRLAPAVIVLVHRGDEVLLARSPHFLPGMYSTLAGFVEPGESLEQTVHREIAEEVGIEVDQVRYFGSQPWPFPHSLMVGFNARYAGGEITLEDPEIEDAGWYRADALPRIPPRVSIARRLIDAFVASRARAVPTSGSC